MILADSMTDLTIGIAMLSGLFGLACYVVVAGVVLLARHMGRDYRKQGGAPALAKKVAVQASAGLLKRLIFGRFK